MGFQGGGANFMHILKKRCIIIHWESPVIFRSVYY